MIELTSVNSIMELPLRQHP